MKEGTAMSITRKLMSAAALALVAPIALSTNSAAQAATAEVPEVAYMHVGGFINTIVVTQGPDEEFPSRLVSRVSSTNVEMCEAGVGYEYAGYDLYYANAVSVVS